MNQQNNTIIEKIEELRAKASEEMFQTISEYLSQDHDRTDTKKSSTSKNI